MTKPLLEKKKEGKCNCSCHKTVTGSLWCGDCWKNLSHYKDRVMRGEELPHDKFPQPKEMKTNSLSEKKYTIEDIKKELANLLIVKCYSCGERMLGYLWNTHERKHIMKNSFPVIGDLRIGWLKVSKL